MMLSMPCSFDLCGSGRWVFFRCLLTQVLTCTLFLELLSFHVWTFWSMIFYEFYCLSISHTLTLTVLLLAIYSWKIMQLFAILLYLWWVTRCLYFNVPSTAQDACSYAALFEYLMVINMLMYFLDDAFNEVNVSHKYITHKGSTLHALWVWSGSLKLKQEITTVFGCELLFRC